MILKANMNIVHLRSKIGVKISCWVMFCYSFSLVQFFLFYTHSPFSHSDAALILERWFVNSPPTVIHTERSISAFPCVIHTESWCCSTYRGMAVHDDDVGVFSRCFTPPVNLNPQTVYNHMDAVIMCCD